MLHAHHPSGWRGSRHGVWAADVLHELRGDDQHHAVVWSHRGHQVVVGPVCRHSVRCGSHCWRRGWSCRPRQILPVPGHACGTPQDVPEACERHHHSPHGSGTCDAWRGSAHCTEGIQADRPQHQRQHRHRHRRELRWLMDDPWPPLSLRHWMRGRGADGLGGGLPRHVALLPELRACGVTFWQQDHPRVPAVARRAHRVQLQLQRVIGGDGDDGGGHLVEEVGGTLQVPLHHDGVGWRCQYIPASLRHPRPLQRGKRGVHQPRREEDGHCLAEVGDGGQEGRDCSRWTRLWKADPGDHQQADWVLQQGDPEPPWRPGWDAWCRLRHPVPCRVHRRQPSSLQVPSRLRQLVFFQPGGGCRRGAGASQWGRRHTAVGGGGGAPAGGVLEAGPPRSAASLPQGRDAECQREPAQQGVDQVSEDRLRWHAAGDRGNVRCHQRIQPGSGVQRGPGIRGDGPEAGQLPEGVCREGGLSARARCAPPIAAALEGSPSRAKAHSRAGSGFRVQGWRVLNFL